MMRYVWITVGCALVSLLIAEIIVGEATTMTYPVLALWALIIAVELKGGG